MTVPPPAVRTAPHPALPRVRDAALVAERVFPGPLGRYLRRELGAWCDLDARFNGDGLVPAVAEDLLARSPAPRGAS